MPSFAPASRTTFAPAPCLVSLKRQAQDIDRFLNVSYSIYNGDPHWVAPLLMDLKKVFTSANPFFDHAEMDLWVVTRNGKDIGRIAAILDRNHNKFQKDNAAFFGFFECANDPEASALLFNAVRDWARQRTLTRLLGPMNPSSNDECGLLVDGFDSPPVLMMTYNPPYYIELMHREGFAKEKDLLAFIIPLTNCPMDRFERIVTKAKRRYPELSYRPVRRKTLKADLAKVMEVYNEAWEENWGFVPMTDPEMIFMAERLKPLLVEGLVSLVECGSEPVGFLLAIPDFNEAFKPMRGRLLSPGLFKAIPYLLNWKHPRLVRTITLGVKERYRGKGIESIMLFEGLKVGYKMGFESSEASWILEDNAMMCRLIETVGGRVYKTYRLYSHAL